MKNRIDKAGIARLHLVRLRGIKELDRDEARRIDIALRNSGVEDATTRLNAGFSRLILKTIVAAD